MRGLNHKSNQNLIKCHLIFIKKDMKILNWNQRTQCFIKDQTCCYVQRGEKSNMNMIKSLIVQTQFGVNW